MEIINSKQPNLAELTANQLRQEIFNGDLTPGTRLAEATVGKRLGVSRVPTREAFATLEKEGLVEFTPTGRTLVKKLSFSDFDEIFKIRILLEPAAARAAFPLTKKQERKLLDNIAATRAAKSLVEVTHLDLDFHELIVKASGNGRLVKLWRSLRSELELWLSSLHRKHQLKTFDTREITARSHEEILNCFRTRTGAACERIIRDHILGWRDWLSLDGE